MTNPNEFPEKVYQFVFDNWTAAGVDKNTDVFWKSWYTGRKDISIFFSELITLPVPVSIPWYKWDYRTYIDIWIHVTDKSGNYPVRMEAIRSSIETAINSNPSGLEPEGIGMMKIDSFSPSNGFDEDYQNDVYKLLIRVQLLLVKNF